MIHYRRSWWWMAQCRYAHSLQTKLTQASLLDINKIIELLSLLENWQGRRGGEGRGGFVETHSIGGTYCKTGGYVPACQWLNMSSSCSSCLFRSRPCVALDFRLPRQSSVLSRRMQNQSALLSPHLKAAPSLPTTTHSHVRTTFRWRRKYPATPTSTSIRCALGSTA